MLYYQTPNLNLYWNNNTIKRPNRKSKTKKEDNKKIEKRKKRAKDKK